MSSQLVAAPVVGIGLVAGVIALPLFGAAGALYGAAKLIKYQVDKEVEKERQKLVEERKKNDELEARWNRKAEEMKVLEKKWKALDAILAAAGPRGTSETREDLFSTEVALKKTAGRKVTFSLSDITGVVDTAIALFEEFEKNAKSFSTVADTGLSILANKVKRKLCSEAGLNMNEAKNFEATVARTLESHRKELAQKITERSNLMQAVPAMLDKVALLERLTVCNRHLTTLRGIKKQLNEFSASGVFINTKGIMATLSREENEIFMELTGKAVRSTLKDSIIKHLSEMNYVLLKKARSGKFSCVMRIPGGEILETTIEENGELRFEVQHETGKQKKLLSKEDIALFRRQEQLWCMDSKKLFKNLGDEGFNYQIGFERKVEDVKIVNVETVDDIESLEAAESRKDYERAVRQNRNVIAKGLYQ
jgi:pyruvate-formate lyase-activating enzyme